MSKELVIGSNRHETKVAILEEDQLVEVYFQRGQEYALAGSIHKGRVTRVLPGMQSAFVDLGLERDTFLYVSDFFDEHDEDIDTVKDDRSQNRGGDRRDRGQNRSRERAPEERTPETVETALTAQLSVPANGPTLPASDTSTVSTCLRAVQIKLTCLPSAVSDRFTNLAKYKLTTLMAAKMSR